MWAKRNLPQHNKDHIRQIHSKLIPNGEKLTAFSPKIRNETRMPTLTTYIQHSFGSPSHGNQRRKRNKMNPSWKRKRKTVTVLQMT